jgi:microcystin-dependent protein
MPFQYTFRADDITTWEAETRDLIENRDRELELSLIGLNGANPVGGIVMWAGAVGSIPANYIKCDGTSYSTSSYPELFAAINYYYGGSGATFAVPNITIPQSTSSNTGRTTSTISTKTFQSTGHVHTLTSPQSTGHTHNFNQTGNTSSSGHTHTLGASTGNGGNDHFHGATTGGASNNTHAHSYFKPNSGANNTTGTGNHGHTHDLTTGLATSYLHAHNAAANVNATNADTAHVHNGSTIANSNADTAHTHTANATTADTAHPHDITSHGVIFIIRYQ